jgi:hypothetical protein
MRTLDPTERFLLEELDKATSPVSRAFSFVPFFKTERSVL